MSYQYIPGTGNFNSSVQAPRNSLTLGLDYYTISTSVNILPAEPYAFKDVVNLASAQPSVADFTNVANGANTTLFVPGTIPNDFSQDALDRLVEIVSQRGQPVILGAPSGPVANVYTFKFAVDHPSAWGVTANSSAQTVPLLANAIQTGGIDFGFNVDASLAVTVTNTF